MKIRQKDSQTMAYKDNLMKALKDPYEAVEYLKMAAEEKDMPGLFLYALKNVCDANQICVKKRALK